MSDSTTTSYPADVGTAFFLLTIRGTYNGKTIEDGRKAHNMAAGSDAGVAAARSLGDLSHAVYIRADKPGTEGAYEGLFIDIWNSQIGLGQFFDNKQVQEGAAYIWAKRDPVLWANAQGFPHFQLPPPRDKGDRFVGLIRGTVQSMDQARKTLEACMKKGINTGRRLGQLSREYFVPADPAAGKDLLLGLDVWTSLDGMNEFYSKHEDPALFQVFKDKPDASIWKRPDGQWVEW